MKLVILYRPGSEHSRLVEEYIHDYKKVYADHIVEILNIDSREGTAKAEIYDITQYPALLAVTDNGEVLKFWQGEPLPLMDEVASYNH